MELPDKDLTAGIISAAIAVHRILGPGFLESIYEEALCIELARRNIAFERQKSIPLTYESQLRRYATDGQAGWQRASQPFLIS